jgi:LmbE family N-acetylglucosaminyl deacetylase
VRQLPTVDGMPEPQRILVIGAHPDDEILGGGGALAVHAEEDSILHFLILSTTIGSRTGESLDTVAVHRLKCAQTVADLYGAQLHLADFPDNRFDTLDQLTVVQRIEEVIRQVQPDIVYTHSTADLSRDHQIVAHATATATRPQPGSTVRTVLSYEVRSATEWSVTRSFRPVWYRRLTPTAVERKLRALAIYESEMRPWPHSRSIPALRAQMSLRGADIGTDAAEAFELIRHIQ